MPELPEVEVFRQYMNSTSLHKKISNVEVKSKTILGKVSLHSLRTRLKDHQFISTTGYGKYLFAKTDNEDFLVIHFGMTGFLKYYKNSDEATKHIRLLIKFNNGYNLVFDDVRKLGRVYLVDNYKQFIKKKKLGIDPIRGKINFSAFKKIINGRKGSVKSVLMNQQIFAGIGNIYSDEILFQAKINPKSAFDKLKKKNLMRFSKR